MDQTAYREIMRHHAGAVTIITVGTSPTRTGLTATAFCSLTDNPPMVLACVNRSASAHDLIERYRAFCVNVLAHGQQQVAMRFAGRVGLDGERRFDPGAWITLATGAPVLEGALANLDCELIEHHDGKTHSIFIGAVRDGRVRAEAQPLIYFRGEFCRVGASSSKPSRPGRSS